MLGKSRNCSPAIRSETTRAGDGQTAFLHGVLFDRSLPAFSFPRGELMPDLYSLIATFVAETRKKIADAKADGSVSLSEALSIFFDAVERLVSAASALSLPGADKKAAVMSAVGKLYDTLIEPIDLPGPDVIVDPALKKVLLVFADGLVEFFVAKLPKSTDATV